MLLHRMVVQDAYLKYTLAFVLGLFVSSIFIEEWAITGIVKVKEVCFSHLENLTTQEPIPDTRSMFSCELAEQNSKQPPKVNFVAAAVGQRYEEILPLYVFYALTAHHSVEGGAVAEIIVPNRTIFLEQHVSSLTWLQETFSNNGTDALCVREYADDHRMRTNNTNTWRYLEFPVRLSAKYTYIGDIDIFLMESVFSRGKRLAQMKEFKIPYSNFVRDYSVEPRLRRLTGVMMVETKEFYTHALRKAQGRINATGNDEMFLYKIVEAAGLGIPPANSTSPLLEWRELHGIHLSYNRGPWMRMCSSSIHLFNKMLQVDRFNKYRRIDHTADRYIAVQQNIIEIQERGEMKGSIDGCVTTKNNLNALRP